MNGNIQSLLFHEKTPETCQHCGTPIIELAKGHPLCETCIESVERFMVIIQVHPLLIWVYAETAEEAKDRALDNLQKQRPHILYQTARVRKVS